MDRKERFLKLVAGIDLAKEEMVVTLGGLTPDLKKKKLATKNFKNTSKGFESLMAWIRKQKVDPRRVIFQMEYTGVYYQNLANYLFHNGYKVVVILPSIVNNYIKSLNQKRINDITF